jgi:hypothetical protein
MRCWHGQLVQGEDGRATALIREGGTLVSVEGILVANLVNACACYVMEHLTVDGKMEFMVGDENILNGNQNFVNFGIPNGKHVRIDIYTGESKVIE